MSAGTHEFIFDRETRRMVCGRCGGVMNECAELCCGHWPELSEDMLRRGYKPSVVDDPTEGW